MRVKGSELRGEAASLLICTAANNEKAECGRATHLPDTAAIGKRQSCGRTFCSFIRPQKGKRRNAAVQPASPIRPQLEKDRDAAVRFAHLYGRKSKKAEMRPYTAPRSALQIRPQKGKGRVAAVHSTSPIRPQLKNHRAAAVHFSFRHGASGKNPSKMLSISVEWHC